MVRDRRESALIAVLFRATPELVERRTRALDLVGRAQEIPGGEARVPQDAEVPCGGLERQGALHGRPGVLPEERLGHRQRGE